MARTGRRRPPSQPDNFPLATLFAPVNFRAHVRWNRRAACALKSQSISPSPDQLVDPLDGDHRGFVLWKPTGFPRRVHLSPAVPGLVGVDGILRPRRTTRV